MSGNKKISNIHTNSYTFDIFDIYFAGYKARQIPVY